MTLLFIAALQMDQIVQMATHTLDTASTMDQALVCAGFPSATINVGTIRHDVANRGHPWFSRFFIPLIIDVFMIGSSVDLIPE